MSGKLSTAHAGLVIGLPLADAAGHDVLEFAGVVRRRRFVRHLKVGFDHIGHVPQQQRCPLLDLVGGGDIQGAIPPPLHHRPCRTAVDHRLHLVAPNAGEADGVADDDAVDDPTQAGMPEDGVTDAAGGGGGDDVIGNFFHLHLRPCEQSILPPNSKSSGHGFHILSLFYCVSGLQACPCMELDTRFVPLLYNSTFSQPCQQSFYR